MKIAFVHYHLKTGGVTTVLKQQIEAVRDKVELLVLTGAQPETPLPCDVVRIPGLGYDHPGQPSTHPKDVAASVARAIHSRWQNGCDVLHVHNPTLAKNKNFIKILKSLQQKNFRLFLQIHDFAEDGRPLAYFDQDEYVADCHYGAINSRDYNILLKAGLKAAGLHKIPNMIKPLQMNAAFTPTKNYILYPIRALRRKNIGEAVLLSLFFKNNETLVITLPPNSPLDLQSYAGWKAFVTQKKLHVAFDSGLTEPFPDLVHSCKFMITTSITEGFGFSFLEPWTARKMLWGRILTDICQDFVENGIRLDHLYTRLRVPIAWLDKDKLFGMWQSSVYKAGTRFNFIIEDASIRDAFEKLVTDQTIDFGLLNEAFQKQIIAVVLTEPAKRKDLIRLNPYLAAPAEVSDPEALIKANQIAVLNAYSQKNYTKTLLNIYKKVSTRAVAQHIDKRILVSEFLNLDNFSLLKWGPYAEE